MMDPLLVLMHLRRDKNVLLESLDFWERLHPVVGLLAEVKSSQLRNITEAVALTEASIIALEVAGFELTSPAPKELFSD